MRTSALATFAVIAACALFACGDRAKKEDCEKLTPFLHGSSTSDCGKVGTPQIPRPTPDEVSASIEKEIGKLRALDLKSDDVRRNRDELVGFHEKERDLCKQYATSDDAKRATLRKSLDDTASDRRGFVEGAKYRCDQIVHPGHL